MLTVDNIVNALKLFESLSFNDLFLLSGSDVSEVLEVLGRNSQHLIIKDGRVTGFSSGKGEDRLRFEIVEDEDGKQSVYLPHFDNQRFVSPNVNPNNREVLDYSDSVVEFKRIFNADVTYSMASVDSSVTVGNIYRGASRSAKWYRPVFDVSPQDMIAKGYWTRDGAEHAKYSWNKG